MNTLFRYPGPELRAHVPRGGLAWVACGFAPSRVERRVHGRGSVADDRQARSCIGTLGPGVANIAGAMMCAYVEISPVIFLGGQRARITERRVRRGRIEFVQQEGLFTPSVKYSSSIEYAARPTRSSTRRSAARCPARRDRPRSSSRRMSSSKSSTSRILCAQQVSSCRPGRGGRPGRRGCQADPGGQEPILLVGHGCTRPAPEQRSRNSPTDGLPGDPDFRRHLLHCRARGPTFAYGFSPAAVEAVVKSDLRVALGTELGEPSHDGKTRHGRRTTPIANGYWSSRIRSPSG